MSDTTPIERRRIRLRNDYITMENIRAPWLDWKATSGKAPYVEEYEIDLRIRTIVGPEPTYRDRHILKVTLDAAYPIAGAPTVRMITKAPPFHPNWFPSGQWCYGTWLVYESLGAHVVRMIQTLQYNDEITNAEHPANAEAKEWYLKNRSKKWFPCDQTPLPDPTGKGRAVPRKTFRVRSST